MYWYFVIPALSEWGTGLWYRGQGVVYARAGGPWAEVIGRGDDAVRDPHRAQICQFELFELKCINSSFSSLSSY